MRVHAPPAVLSRAAPTRARYLDCRIGGNHAIRTSVSVGVQRRFHFMIRCHCFCTIMYKTAWAPASQADSTDCCASSMTDNGRDAGTVYYLECQHLWVPRRPPHPLGHRFSHPTKGVEHLSNHPYRTRSHGRSRGCVPHPSHDQSDQERTSPHRSETTTSSRCGWRGCGCMRSTGQGLAYGGATDSH